MSANVWALLGAAAVGAAVAVIVMLYGLTRWWDKNNPWNV